MTEPNRTARPAKAPIPDEATAAAYDAAWELDAPSGDAWTARPWVHPTKRAEAGKAARKRVPRPAHAAFEPAPDRDPIAILEAQEADRLPDLVPLRHERMAASAFAYYRGTPAVMAFDLAGTPRTDILVQASGDAHISNFGLFASPERTLVFDANDFDETLPGPWEWDVKRLAASVTIAGRANGFSASRDPRRDDGRRPQLPPVDGPLCRDAPHRRPVRLDHRRRHPRGGRSDGMLAGRSGADRRQRLEAIFSKARQRDGMRAFESLTGVVDGRRVLLDDPPVVIHMDFESIGGPQALEKVFTDYRATMPENRRDFLERYRFVDVALKVVGVGSVGTRCFILVLEGRDENDPLILQAKEATASVMEPFVGATVAREPGPARRRRPADHAGHLRRLPRLDAGPGRPRLLPPPAVGHEGLGRHHDPPAARASASTPASAVGPWPGRTPARATRSRSRPTSGRATRSTARSPTSPRPTRTSTRETTLRTSLQSRPGGCRQRWKVDAPQSLAGRADRATNRLAVCCGCGRGGGIRTHDLVLPKHVRCQASLHPVRGRGSHDTRMPPS